MGWSLIKYFILPLAAALLYARGHPLFFGRPLWGPPILGIALLFFTFSETNVKSVQDYFQEFKRNFICALSFSFGTFVIGFYWIAGLLNEFGQIPPPYNYALSPLFSFIVMPQYFAFVAVWPLLRKFCASLALSSSARYCLYALALTLLEYFVPQQFPAHLGHSWFPLAPNLGLAPILGAPFFSFVSFWAALELRHFIFEAEKKIPWSLAFLSVTLAINFLFTLKFPNIESNKNIPSINLRLVQANIGNLLKIESEKGGMSALSKVVAKYKDLSLLPTKLQSLDLIIWPETAYPNTLISHYLKQFPEDVPKTFQEIIDQKGAELFIGGYDRDSTKTSLWFESEYNTTFFFGKQDGQTVLKDLYHKRKLIPFGETLPFGPLNKYLSEVIRNVSYFAKGERFVGFTTKSGIQFSTAICYEILFSQFIKEYLNSIRENPKFLINLTNDSWYGRTSEPYQHLYLSHWRALEFNLPIVRMTNTGITSILYPDGTESRRSQLFEEEILDFSLPLPPREVPLFQRYGIYLTLITGTIVMVVLNLLTRKRNRIGR